jgi:uncharacterized protein
MSRIFDAHLHLFSRPYFEALARVSPLPGSVEERLATVAARAGIEIPGPDLGAHVRRWLASFDRHGVERAVAFASAPEEAPAVAEAARLAGGRLVPVGLVNPKAEGAPARVETLFATHGFRGVLLFPALHGYRVCGPEARAVLEVVARHKGLAIVQCGLFQVKVRDLLALPRTTDLTHANPLDLIPAADAFPTVRFVIPHLGAGFLRETLMAGTQCANVLVDLSSSNSWLATQTPALDLPGALAAALLVFGPERILFGTDSSTFPRGWRHDLLASALSAFDALGLTPGARARILHDNSAALLA